MTTIAVLLNIQGTGKEGREQCRKGREGRKQAGKVWNMQER